MWRADYEKPVRTTHKQGEMSSTVFPKMFICRLRLAQPRPQKREMQNSCSPKLFMFREAGTQVSPFTMSSPSLRTAISCLPLDIEDSLKEDVRYFALGFCFWIFDVGGFWKGKGLLKEKELLKENC
jgi:hypothetical protein